MALRWFHMNVRLTPDNTYVITRKTETIVNKNVGKLADDFLQLIARIG